MMGAEMRRNSFVPIVKGIIKYSYRVMDVIADLLQAKINARGAEKRGWLCWECRWKIEVSWNVLKGCGTDEMVSNLKEGQECRLGGEVRTDISGRGIVCSKAL